MHVFADLRPYICTFSVCSDEFLQFPTRKAWAQHEFDEHRVIHVWTCPECDTECSTPELWRDHLRQGHGCTLPRYKLQIAMATAFRCRDKPIAQEVCPLCLDYPGNSLRKFVTHVGRHMEEIALMVLPRETEETSDTSSEPGNEVLNESPDQASLRSTNSLAWKGPFSEAEDELTTVDHLTSIIRGNLRVGTEVAYKLANTHGVLQKPQYIQCIIASVIGSGDEMR